jgi:hypothetical protein
LWGIVDVQSDAEALLSFSISSSICLVIIQSEENVR